MSRSKPSSPTTSSRGGPRPAAAPRNHASAEFLDAGGGIETWMRRNQMLAAAIASAPTGVVIADPHRPDCPIVFMNPAFATITGYGPADVLGRNCRFLQGRDTDPATVARLRAAIAARRPVTVELLNHRRDGTRFWNELRVSPVLDDAGQLLCFIGIQHDITARRRAEARQRRAQARAEQANRSKSDFLAFISHEIRTPMNGVMGTIGLLLETALDSEQRAYAETAHRCGEALLSVVNEVLDLSRIEAGQLQIERVPFDLAQPVRTVLDLLAPAAAEKGLSLSAAFDPALPARIVGDPQRLRQVLMNLMDNAVKFTASGSVSVALSVANQPAPGTLTLQVAVTDTGIGIAPAAQARLFRSFTQADPSIARRFGGSGLGLTICRHLVRLMDGRIAVESAVGHGSIFRFWLPVEAVADSGRAPPRLAPAPIAQAQQEPGAQGHILLADDSQASQLVAAAMLRKAGYGVDLARDGSQAVALARRRAYDLVLMDVNMPGMDGCAATAAIRALPGDAGRVPILALTAAAMPADRARCVAAGMDGHLPKPIARQVLLAAVADAIATHGGGQGAAIAPSRPAALLDHQTLEELRAAVGPGRLPRLLAVFATETRERLLRMMQAEAAADAASLAREAHALKSAAGTFGCAALRDLAIRLEQAANRPDPAEALALAAGLPALVDQSLAALPAAEVG